MADEIDPPRKFYGFKPADYERVNQPPPDADTAPESPRPDPGVVSAGNARIDVNDLIRAATGDGRLLDGTNSAANRANDVHVILQENHARAEAAGLNELKPMSRRPSKRRRDYWILLIGGNLFILSVYSFELVLGFQVQCLAAGMPGEFLNLIRFAFVQVPVLVMIGFFMSIYSFTLTWLMFGVMSDY